MDWDKNTKNSSANASDPSDWMIGSSSGIFSGLAEPITKSNLINCREAGIDCIEMCLLGGWTKNYAGTIQDSLIQTVKWAKDTGIQVWSIHLNFDDDCDISSLDKAIRRTSLEHYLELMECASNLGVKIATIHASEDNVQIESRDERMYLCKESLFTLAEKGKTMGITPAVECLPRTCLGNTIAEVKELISVHNALYVCMDVNHLLIDTHEDFIKSIGSRIITLHISDYDRINERHWIPGKGIIDWNLIIEYLSKVGYGGPFMFEVRRLNDGIPLRLDDLTDCWHHLLDKYKCYCARNL